MQITTQRKMVGGLNRREQDAMTWMYDQSFGRVLNQVRSQIGDSPETDDLVYKCYLKFLKHNGHFMSLKKMRAFMTEITKNACEDHKRHEIVKWKYIESVSQQPVAYEYPNQDAENRAHLRSVLYPIVEQLNPLCREIFKLYYIEQLTNKEIAARLHISEKTVRNNKAIAIKRLSEYIEQHGGRARLLLNIIL